MRRTTALLGLVAGVVLALDIATKVWVVAELEGRRQLELLGGQLLIRVSRNPGAAFSFAEGATLLFTAIAVTVVVVILRVSRRLGSRGWAVSLRLLLGGASGNLVDRLLRSPGPARGAVVDFIDGLQESGFKIENPNATASCGCGHSFQVADEDPATAEDPYGGPACGSGCGH